MGGEGEKGGEVQEGWEWGWEEEGQERVLQDPVKVQAELDPTAKEKLWDMRKG